MGEQTRLQLLGCSEQAMGVDADDIVRRAWRDRRPGIVFFSRRSAPISGKSANEHSGRTQTSYSVPRIEARCPRRRSSAPTMLWRSGCQIFAWS
jgi:hypothetical protein